MMRYRNVLVLVLIVAAGWLTQPWTWLQSRSPARSPALCIDAGRPSLSAREAGHRLHKSQPDHWRALVLRASMGVRR
jgi:hypothetical protein